MNSNGKDTVCSTTGRWVRYGILAGLLHAAALGGLQAQEEEKAEPEPPPENGTAEAAAEEKPTPEPRAITGPEDLSLKQVEAAISAMQQNYLSPESVGEEALRRATLEGLLKRVGGGAEVVSSGVQKAVRPPAAFVAEIIDGRAGYLRLGELTPDVLAQMDAALKQFASQKPQALILDLRGVESEGFEQAAEFARRFCPKGKVLFIVRKPVAKQERIFTSNQDPAFQGLIIVLTDRETSGGAEALAAALRENAGAMVVGETTAGRAVEHMEVDLGEGAVLKVAIAEVVLPDETKIFPAGVQADIVSALPVTMRDRIFKMSENGGVSQFVLETPRPRMNEAALIAGTNPEITADRTSQNGQKIQDTALQRAMDLITAIRLFRPDSR